MSLRRQVVGVLILAFIGVRSRARQPAAPAQFGKGDVFVAVSNGQVQWRLPNGTLKQALETGGKWNKGPRGMAIDKNGKLYVTTFQNQQVITLGPSGGVLPFGADYNSNPESIVFDSRGNAYVGEANGSANILKFGPSGKRLASIPAAREVRGTDWIDLAADQCTLYYTSEGKSVKRINVCTTTQLPDFATDLPGNKAFALRILPDSELLVADSEFIVRLDPAGRVGTYSIPGQHQWFALNLDPDGSSFWSADQRTGDVYKFDVTTGNQLLRFSAGPGARVDGLAVMEEITAAGGHPAEPLPPDDSKGKIRLPPSFLWDTVQKVIVELVVAGVIACATGLITFLMVRRRFRQRYDAAAKQYTKRIGEQISPKKPPPSIEVHARSIVSVRDDLQGSLLALNTQLNSDIDVLKECVAKQDMDGARVTIQVLQNKWTAKSDQIEIEIRKLLAELGLERL